MNLKTPLQENIGFRYGNTNDFKRKYSEEYGSLCSIYDYDPLINPEDSLTALLEENCNSDEDIGCDVKYLRVQDIIKTKGDSIYGPHRQGISLPKTS